jgi:hypothetical protein
VEQVETAVFEGHERTLKYPDGHPCEEFIEEKGSVFGKNPLDGEWYLEDGNTIVLKRRVKKPQ